MAWVCLTSASATLFSSLEQHHYRSGLDALALAKLLHWFNASESTMVIRSNHPNRFGNRDLVYLRIQFDQWKSFCCSHIARSNRINTGHIYLSLLQCFLGCSTDVLYHCGWACFLLRRYKLDVARESDSTNDKRF